MSIEGPEEHRENHDAGTADLAARRPVPPLRRHPLTAVTPSTSKTPGVGGYLKMMFFNPNHALSPAPPRSLPVPDALITEIVHDETTAGPHSGVLGSTLPPLPSGPPPWQPY